MVSSLCSGSSVNHSATAHLRPLVTAVTPCMFSGPAENPTIRPHLGVTYCYADKGNGNGNNHSQCESACPHPSLHHHLRTEVFWTMCKEELATLEVLVQIQNGARRRSGMAGQGRPAIHSTCSPSPTHCTPPIHSPFPPASPHTPPFPPPPPIHSPLPPCLPPTHL